MKNIYKFNPSALDKNLFKQRASSKDGVKVSPEEKAKPKIPNYRYSNQIIIPGEITYQESPELGRGREINLDFQLRSGSGILIISSQADFDLDAVVEKMGDISEGGLRVYRNITPDRAGLWEFISDSERIIEIKFTYRGKGDTSPSDISDITVEELAEDYPVSNATCIFKYKEESVLVRYTGGDLIIDTDSDNVLENIIQRFEQNTIT